jgi:hypothetical protein
MASLRRPPIGGETTRARRGNAARFEQRGPSCGESRVLSSPVSRTTAGSLPSASMDPPVCWVRWERSTPQVPRGWQFHSHTIELARAEADSVVAGNKPLSTDALRSHRRIVMCTSMCNDPHIRGHGSSRLAIDPALIECALLVSGERPRGPRSRKRSASVVLQGVTNCWGTFLDADDESHITIYYLRRERSG